VVSSYKVKTFAGRSYCVSTSTVREEASARILDANVYKVQMSTL